MFRLVLANLLRRPARTILTVAAIALSVALVVSTTSGYASAELAVRGFINDFLGSDDLRIDQRTDSDGIPGSFINELRRDPQVANAYGRLAVNRHLRSSTGDAIATPFTVLGVDPDTDGYISRLPLDSGRLFDEIDANEIVLDTFARDNLGVELGDTVTLPGPAGNVDLEVVGIIFKPGILNIMGAQSIYMPLRTLQELTRPDAPDRHSAVLAELVQGGEIGPVVDRLADRFEAEGKPWRPISLRATRETVDNGLAVMNLLSLMGGMVSLLAAAFIVFGTLSMGVAERQRTLAMLRSIGATKLQVAGGVVGEGLMLALLGVTIGVPLGVVFVFGLTTTFSAIFSAGVAIGWLGIVAAVLGMAAIAMLASAAPAWTASRVDPLSAMRPAAAPARKGPPWRSFVIGLFLMSIDVLLLWLPLPIIDGLYELERNVRFWMHFLIGLPLLMLGFFLIAPMLIWLADQVLSRPVSRLLGLTPGLLRQQLGGGLWRAAGTAAALMVGPAVLIVMNTQGRSGIEGWQLPDDFPDVFLYNKNGIPADRIDELGEVDGFARLPDGSPDISPIGYLHPRLGDSFFAIAGGVAIESTMFIAIDPNRIFTMMDLDFTAGDADSAARLLDRGVRATLDDGTSVFGTIEPGDVLKTLETVDEPGRDIPMAEVVSTEGAHFLIVTEEFRQLRGLGPGDPFILRKPGQGLVGRIRGEPVEFIITGVVRSPGIDVMVSSFDLSNQFEGQSAASVFGTLDDARQLFNMQDVFLVAANLEMGIDKEVVVARVADQLGDSGIAISDVRQLKFEIQQGLKRLLLVAGTVAWAALAVSSLGVTNTVMAGVRSRRYQLGVLRAIGVTRGEMGRLIVAEAVLLGLAAAALGISAGLLMAMNSRQLQSWTVGYVPPLRVAWDVIVIGVVTVIVVSMLAAWWPARRASREPVLSLLSAGRSAT